QTLDGALVIISGRDIRDLDLRIPDSFWRVGGHGADICAPGVAAPTGTGPVAPPALLVAVRDICRRLNGLRLEPKGPVLALHYRTAPELAAQLMQEIKQLLPAHPAYSMQRGKMVIELRPKGLDKGKVIADL